MNAYLTALESFENETRQIYGDFVLESFAPTGAMESIGNRVQQAWNTLKELAHKIWEVIKEAGRKIKGAIGKIVGMIRKSPDVVVADSKDVTVLNNEADDILKQMNEKANQFKEVSDAAWEAVENDEPEAAVSVIDRIKDLFSKANDSFTESAEEQAKDFFSRLCESALEADEGEAEKPKETKKFNVGAIKQKIAKAASFASDQLGKVEQLVSKITQKINSHKPEDDENAGEETKKQGAWSRILRALGSFANFFRSIPSKASALFGRIFKKGGATVNEYNGPDPTAQPSIG